MVLRASSAFSHRSVILNNSIFSIPGGSCFFLYFSLYYSMPPPGHLLRLSSNSAMLLNRGQ